MFLLCCVWFISFVSPSELLWDLTTLNHEFDCELDDICYSKLYMFLLQHLELYDFCCKWFSIKIFMILTFSWNFFSASHWRGSSFWIGQMGREGIPSFWNKLGCEQLRHCSGWLRLVFFGPKRRGNRNFVDICWHWRNFARAFHSW